MKIIKHKNLYGYFGNAKDDLKVNGNYKNSNFLMLSKKLLKLSNTSLKTLFFLEQKHSNLVHIIDKNSELKSPLDLHNIEGDAIITNQKNIAIGIATADCLPLFLYDPTMNVIAVIHAGWRGLVAAIITETIEKMKTTFKVKPSNIIAHLGPTAKNCCYEVKEDFLEFMPTYAQAEKIIEIRDSKLFFNSTIVATHDLLENGVLESNIETFANECTICKPGYCSVRLQSATTGRQPSVAFMR